METSRRETMRQCGFANVSSSHVSARLSSIVSRQRARPHLAGGGCVRGTSHIAIGEMARIWREITVRNVVVRELRLAPPERLALPDAESASAYE